MKKEIFNEEILKDIFEFLVSYFKTPERVGIEIIIKYDDNQKSNILIGQKATGPDPDYGSKSEKYQSYAEKKADGAKESPTGSVRGSNIFHVYGGFYLSSYKFSIGCSGLNSPFADECFLAIILQESDYCKNLEDLPSGLQEFLVSDEYLEVLRAWKKYAEVIWF